MRLTDDLTSSKAILVKGWLFLFLGVLAGAGLLIQNFSWQKCGLLLIATGAFCRWYYFMFYVIQNYVDPSYKFDGLTSFVRFMWKERRGT